MTQAVVLAGGGMAQAVILAKSYRDEHDAERVPGAILRGL